MKGLSLTVESVAQWLEHRSTESEALRFDSSWGLRTVFFVPRS